MSFYTKKNVDRGLKSFHQSHNCSLQTRFATFVSFPHDYPIMLRTINVREERAWFTFAI